MKYLMKLKQLGEDGATTQLLNIIIINENVGTRVDVNVQEQPIVLFYVEIPINTIVTQETRPT